jgi:hypothetical protein
MCIGIVHGLATENQPFTPGRSGLASPKAKPPCSQNRWCWRWDNDDFYGHFLGMLWSIHGFIGNFKGMYQNEVLQKPSWFLVFYNDLRQFSPFKRLLDDGVSTFWDKVISSWLLNSAPLVFNWLPMNQAEIIFLKGWQLQKSVSSWWDHPTDRKWWDHPLVIVSPRFVAMYIDVYI